jgi:recombination protein RecT
MAYQKKPQGGKGDRGPYKPKDKNPELYKEAVAAVQALFTRQVMGSWSRRKKGTLKWEIERDAALRSIQKTERAARAAKSNPHSVVAAMLECAGLGLTLHQTMAYAYLTPETFGDIDAIALTVGYRGMEQLALRSGTVKNISTELVFKNDTFRRGLNRDGSTWVEFEQARGDRGDLEGGFCRALLGNGTMHVEWMNWQEIQACEAAADKRSGGNNGWKGPFYQEFQKKSIVRRAAKHWQLEGEFAEELKIIDKLEPMNFDQVNNAQPANEANEQVSALTDEHKQEIRNRLGNEFDLTADKVDDWMFRQCEAWGHPEGTKTYADAGWEKLYAALNERANRLKAAKEQAS